MLILDDGPLKGIRPRMILFLPIRKQGILAIWYGEVVRLLQSYRSERINPISNNMYVDVAVTSNVLDKTPNVPRKP